MQRHWGVVGLMGLLAVAGCSSAGDPPGCESGCGAPPIAAEDFADTVERDVCAALRQCTSIEYFDLDHCVRDRELQGASGFRSAVDEGWVVYDAEAAGACHQAFETQPCGFTEYFLFVPDFYDVVQVCAWITGAAIITGQQPLAGACTNDLHCASGAFCDTGATCPGLCSARGVQGFPCEGQRQCADGFVCVEDLCQPEAGRGDPCTSTSECALEFFCVRAEGTCGPRLGVGELCTFGDCGEGLYCDDADSAESAVCRRDALDGEPCATIFACASGLRCVREGAAFPGTCRAPAARDESCADGRGCEPDSRCVDDVCAPLAALGEACIQGFAGDDCGPDLLCSGGACREARAYGEPCGDGVGVCLEGRCVSGTCEPRLESGEACTLSSQCVSRVCRLGVCTDPEC